MQDLIVLRPFSGGGKQWAMNETVPGQVAEGWRNRRTLIEQRYLAPATAAKATAAHTAAKAAGGKTKGKATAADVPQGQE
jgi:hypothetical protein